MADWPGCHVSLPTAILRLDYWQDDRGLLYGQWDTLNIRYLLADDVICDGKAARKWSVCKVTDVNCLWRKGSELYVKKRRPGSELSIKERWLTVLNLFVVIIAFFQFLCFFFFLLYPVIVFFILHIYEFWSTPLNLISHAMISLMGLSTTKKSWKIKGPF